MKLIRRDPRVAYLDNWLWLPKSHISDRQVRGALTYIDRLDRFVQAFEDEPSHFRVPRNFLSDERLKHGPYPVYDARFKGFPSADLRSSVTLDAKEPDKDYQSQGNAALHASYDGILCLRCGAGKTVVALHTASQVKQPVLIVVDDKGLAKQWLTEIEQFLGIPPADVGKLWGGQKFDWQVPIAVATVQTLASRVADNKLPDGMTHHFGVVLMDEAHVMGAPYFNTAIPPFHGRRWGLSATPTREDEFDSLLKYTVGGVIYTYLMPSIMPTVYFKRLETKLDYANPEVHAGTHDKFGKFHFGKTYGYMARSCPERTKNIVAEIQAALNTGRQILVLSHSRDMVELLGQHFPNGGVTHGGVKEDEHWRVVQDCNPVISIMKRGKQALNKPTLDTLFIIEPFSKAGVLQQTMGRVLRHFAGLNKQPPVIIIFEDKYVEGMTPLCGKLRTLLNRWPENRGGRITYKNI